MPTSTVLQMLDELARIKPFGYEKCENFGLVINGLYLHAGTTLGDVVARCGNELRIEPLSFGRVVQDLIIDESDFVSKLKPF